jgi:hypothetical protein
VSGIALLYLRPEPWHAVVGEHRGRINEPNKGAVTGVGAPSHSAIKKEMLRPAAWTAVSSSVGSQSCFEVGERPALAAQCGRALDPWSSGWHGRLEITYLEVKPSPHERAAREGFVRHCRVHPLDRVLGIACVEARGRAGEGSQHVMHVGGLRRPVLISDILRDILPALAAIVRGRLRERGANPLAPEQQVASDTVFKPARAARSLPVTCSQ